MSQPAGEMDFIRDHDDAYSRIFENLKEFFRFETRHPGAPELDREFYERAAYVFKERIEFELRNLKKPYLD